MIAIVQHSGVSLWLYGVIDRSCLLPQMNSEGKSTPTWPDGNDGLVWPVTPKSWILRPN